MYATALGRDPAAVYRQVDAVGRTAEADGPALVQLLYEEAIRALGTAAWATEHAQLAKKSEAVTRATAILFALEAGLDFDAGGEVAMTLSRLYAGARGEVVAASVGRDSAPFRRVAATLGDIAAAWATARAA